MRRRGRRRSCAGGRRRRASPATWSPWPWRVRDDEVVRVGAVACRRVGRASPRRAPSTVSRSVVPSTAPVSSEQGAALAEEQQDERRLEGDVLALPDEDGAGGEVVHLQGRVGRAVAATGSRGSSGRRCRAGRGAGRGHGLIVLRGRCRASSRACRFLVRGPPPVACPTEDSHSGLVRTIGNRVGIKPSGVQIPHPPPQDSWPRRAQRSGAICVCSSRLVRGARKAGDGCRCGTADCPGELDQPCPARPPLSSFWHDLPREGKLLISTVVFQSIGTGLVLPFMVVYLHEVRGIPLETVGLLLALQAGVGIVLVGAGGGAHRPHRAASGLREQPRRAARRRRRAGARDDDRAGGRWRSCSWATASASCGRRRARSSATSSRPSSASATSASTSRCSTSASASAASSVAASSTSSRPGTFVTIYLLDAAQLPAGAGHPARPAAARPATGSSGRPTRAPRRSPTSRCCATPGCGRCCSSSRSPRSSATPSSTPGCRPSRGPRGGSRPRGSGYAFAANTVVIVVLQLFVLQRIEGRRRTRVTVVMALTGWSRGRCSARRPRARHRRRRRSCSGACAGGLRSRRDDAPADERRDGQRPRARPPARPLQRAQLADVLGRPSSSDRSSRASSSAATWAWSTSASSSAGARCSPSSRSSWSGTCRRTSTACARPSRRPSQRPATADRAISG